MAQTQTTTSPPQMRVRFSVCTLLVGMIALCIVFAVTYYVQHWRRAGSRKQLVFDARSIVLDIHQVETINGMLPPAVERDESGNATHSWRYIVSRNYFGDTVQAGFYGQGYPGRNFAWNSPECRRYFVGPHWSGGPATNFIGRSGSNATRFGAVTGPGTAFDESREVSLSDLDIDTILFMEKRDEANHHWMKPGGDFEIATIEEYFRKHQQQNGDGFVIAFADAEVWSLRNVPVAELKKFLTIGGAKQFDRETLLRPYTR